MKLLSPARRRQAVEHCGTTRGISERRACRMLGQPRSTERYQQEPLDDEAALLEIV